MDLNNACAVVTGAASGLGAATAACLADRGAQVVGIDLPHAVEKAPEIPRVIYREANVTDAEAIRQVVQEASRIAPLRVAVSCAGIAPGARILGKHGPHDPELFNRVIAINLGGTFALLTAAAEAMSQTEPMDDDGQRGLIVNTASVAAFEGQVGQVAYAASKGGVHSLTLAAARDLAGQGIRVCSIAPGVIGTPLLDGIDADFRAALEATVPFPPRLGTPAEYAQLVNMLVDHSYLNGETIRMDGALRMAPR